MKLWKFMNRIDAPPIFTYTDSLISFDLNPYSQAL